MHSFLDFHSPLMQSLLLAQWIGFPVAFVVRSVIWAVRARRGSEAERRRGRLLAGGNLCFAGALLGFCALSGFSLTLAFLAGVALLLAGGGLSVAAHQQARRLAPPRPVPAARQPPPAPISIRASRLGRRAQP